MTEDKLPPIIKAGEFPDRVSAVLPSDDEDTED